MECTHQAAQTPQPSFQILAADQLAHELGHPQCPLLSLQTMSDLPPTERPPPAACGLPIFLPATSAGR